MWVIVDTYWSGRLLFVHVRSWLAVPARTGPLCHRWTSTAYGGKPGEPGAPGVVGVPAPGAAKT